VRPPRQLTIVPGEQDPQLAEGGSDGRSALLGEWLEQFAGCEEQLATHRAGTPPAGRRERKARRTPIGRIGLALYEPGPDEGCRQASHDRRADHQPPGDLALRAGPLEVDHAQHVVLLIGE
jgi:hypothetical protein